MLSIYLYALDTMADWEIGHIMAELNSKRFFKDGAPELSVKVCALSKEPVKTMGGLTIKPDCALDEIAMDDKSVLLLPGSTAWDEPKHAAAVQKASELLSCGGTVAAICGATLALAHAGHLASVEVGDFRDLACGEHEPAEFVHEPVPVRGLFEAEDLVVGDDGAAAIEGR